MPATIHCANCLHCKTTWVASEVTGSRERRVRCAAGMWTNAAGGEKTYSLHTVLERRVDGCACHDRMGDDEAAFLRDLRENLPSDRIVMQAPRRGSGWTVTRRLAS